MRGERELQEQFRTEVRAAKFYSEQLLDHLNPAMMEFLRRQEMVFIATSDAAGECDSSFRAGEGGFIHVIDAGTLAYPEYRGNGVLASLGNIHENAHVGMLFVDFVEDLIGLHVNGRAVIVEDQDLRRRLPDLPLPRTRNRQPECWVVVTVQEAYIHCRKHIPRMMPAPTERAWGTDDATRKGGDFFHAKAERSADA